MNNNNNRVRKPLRGRGRGRRGRGGRKNINNVKLGFVGRVVPLRFNYQPPRLENIIRYHETFATSVLTLSFHDQVINLVNIFDPNVTGIGRVGYGWEICSQLYARYRVMKVKYTVRVCSTDKILQVCVVPNNGINVFTDIDFPSELPFARTGMTMFGSPPFVDIRTRSMDTLTGVSFDQYMIGEVYEGIIAAPSTTPTNAILLHICKYNINTSTVVAVTTVDMEYSVLWYDPINIAPTTRMIKGPIEETSHGEKTLSSETQQIEDEEEQLMKRLKELKLEKELLHKKV